MGGLKRVRHDLRPWRAAQNEQHFACQFNGSRGHAGTTNEMRPLERFDFYCAPT